MIRLPRAQKRSVSGIFVLLSALIIAALSGYIIPGVFYLPAKTQNFYLLLFIASLYGVLALISIRKALWVGLLACVVFISVTGFQYDINKAAGFRFSALDLMLLFLAFGVTIAPPRKYQGWTVYFPWLKKAIIYYLWLIPLGILVGLLRGIEPWFIASLVKSFYYPMLFLYIVPRIATGKNALTVLIGLTLLVGVFSAYRSRVEGPPIDQPVSAKPGQMIQRAAGEWGTQNTFANYLILSVLVPVAFALHLQRPAKSLIMAVLATVAAWGLLGTFSRGAWLGCTVGLAFLTLIDRFNKIIVIGLAALIILPILPSAVHQRAVETHDSSTRKRQNWWKTGWYATLNSPVVGNGWGSDFYLIGDGVKPGTGGFPQWHNDYLAVSSQTGVIGFLVFIGMWRAFLRTGLSALKDNKDPFYRPLVIGLTATLVASLVHAFFEQVFWRFDSGPHNWFYIACLLTAALHSKILVSEQKEAKA